jgi:hypothetical protein
MTEVPNSAQKRAQQRAAAAGQTYGMNEDMDLSNLAVRDPKGAPSQLDTFDQRAKENADKVS